MEDMIGCYKLHEDSKKRLDEMGYICQEGFRANGPGIASHTVEDHPENPLPDNFYEIDVLERHLNVRTPRSIQRLQMTCGYPHLTLTEQ